MRWLCQVCSAVILCDIIILPVRHYPIQLVPSVCVSHLPIYTIGCILSYWSVCEYHPIMLQRWGLVGQQHRKVGPPSRRHSRSRRTVDGAMLTHRHTQTTNTQANTNMGIWLTLHCLCLHCNIKSVNDVLCPEGHISRLIPVLCCHL